MRLIIAGGGQPSRTSKIDRFAVGLIGKGRVLFLPHAVAPGEWTARGAFQWLMRSSAWRQCEVTMWQRMSPARRRQLGSFNAIYLMGGQTLTLHRRLRRMRMSRALRAYLQRGGLVFGLSAGAIILGHDLETAVLGQDGGNSSGASQMSGMNCLRGHNVYPHYRANVRGTLREYVESTSRAVIAIPETSALYATDQGVVGVGDRPIQLFSRLGERTLRMGVKKSWREFSAS